MIANPRRMRPLWNAMLTAAPSPIALLAALPAVTFDLYWNVTTAAAIMMGSGPPLPFMRDVARLKWKPPIWWRPA